MMQNMQQMMIAQDARMTEMRTAFESRVSSLSQPRKRGSVIDTKGLSNAPMFKNTEEDWPEFRFKFENWLGGIWKEARPYLRATEDEKREPDDLTILTVTQVTPLTDEELEQVQSSVHFDTAFDSL